MIIVLSILILLFTLSSVNVSYLLPRTASVSSVEQLISDLKYVQIKAMLGDTEGRTEQSSYGIHFNSSSYTIFHGDTFNPADESNYTIQANDTIEFQPQNLPNDNLIFAAISGELVGYTGNDQVLIIHNKESQRQDQVSLNQYGVIAVNRL